MRIRDGYEMRACLERLCERRAAWTQALGMTGADHVGRMPIEGLAPPVLEPDPGLSNRTPEWIARQFRRCLKATPVVIEPWDPSPSGFAWNLAELVPCAWPREEVAARILPEPGESMAGIVHVNVGMPGHLVPDLALGLREGWGGTLARIRAARSKCEGVQEAYWGVVEEVHEAAGAFIRRHEETARAMAATAPAREGAVLEHLADAIENVLEDGPATFHEAVVWMTFFMSLNRTFNGQNTIGRLDFLLHDWYARDVEAGRLNEEEAVFLLQALLVHDTHFMCLGGLDEGGRDAVNPLSFLVLRAQGEMGGPANTGLRCSEAMAPGLLNAALRLLVEQGQGTPALINDEAVIRGFHSRGVPLEQARAYAYGGCHWWQVPGRQHGLCDGTKINLLLLFHRCMERMMQEGNPSLERLWGLFEAGLDRAFACAARCYEVELDGPGRTFRELFMAPFVHGPLETGRDIKDGGVEHLLFVADAMGLANVADGFSALHSVIIEKELYGWEDVWRAVRGDFEGGARIRAALCAAPRFGNDDAEADAVAEQVRDLCVEAAARAEPADGRFRILPGFYSWIVHAHLRDLHATVDGRLGGTTLAHGANPAAGRAVHGPTAMARSVARVQTGCGASSPLHLELSPMHFAGEAGLARLRSLVRGFFREGGTQVIVNHVDPEVLRAARKRPEMYRDLVVRVTGFSAHYVSLPAEVQDEILARRFER